MILKKIEFPIFTGVRCNMMPFIQGDPLSLPEEYRSYSDIVANNYLEKGKIGLITIDEKFVPAGKSQRGYNSRGINRNVHIEVGHYKDVTAWGGSGVGWGSPKPTPNVGWGSQAPMIGWGGTTWGGKPNVILDKATKVLIANSISDTCKLWDKEDYRFTHDGDLSEYINDYPEDTGILMKAGDLAKISIFTPHECIAQAEPGNRQFFRIVGEGVTGREDYFTVNPLLDGCLN